MSWMAERPGADRDWHQLGARRVSQKPAANPIIHASAIDTSLIDVAPSPPSPVNQNRQDGRSTRAATQSAAVTDPETNPTSARLNHLTGRPILAK
jgi:hypothetical protein